eukprot:scaffold420_cov169-Ochromonas_danica.AAC.16
MAGKKYWGDSQLSFSELDILGLFVQKKLAGGPLPSYEKMENEMKHFVVPRKYHTNNLFRPSSSSSSSSHEDVIDLTNNFPYFLPNGLEDETLLTSSERHLLHHPVNNNRHTQLYMAKSKPRKRRMSNPAKNTSASSSGYSGDEPIQRKRGRPRKTIQQSDLSIPIAIPNPLTTMTTTAAATSTASSSSILMNKAEDLYFMENEESVLNDAHLVHAEDNVYFTVDSEEEGEEEEGRRKDNSQSLITTNGVIVENDSGISESKELYSNPHSFSADLAADDKARAATMSSSQVRSVNNVSMERNSAEDLTQVFPPYDVKEGDTKFNHGMEPSVNGKLPSPLIIPQTTTTSLIS